MKALSDHLLCRLPARARPLLRLLLPFLALLTIAVGTIHAQGSTPISLALSKTSNAPTPVPSGQTFTYTIAYSWSGGAPGTLEIIDTVPTGLDVISTLPSATVTGNIVNFQITGLAASAGAGTVQINVRFKPGVTCNGDRACNTAWIRVKGNDKAVQSNNVCNTASATNKWTFEKALVAGCALDNDVIFRVCAINPAGGDIGGLNLTNVSLTDVLPANAVVTSVSGSWTTFTQSGTNVTLGGGPTTLPVSPWNAWYCVYIHVTFPSANFTQGQSVVNNATLSYTTPCTQQKATYTDTAKVTLCAANSTGSLGKYLSINIYFPSNPYYYPSFSPGCCGSYTLSYYNGGNVAQPGFVMEDQVPSTLDVSTVQTNVPTGNSVTVEVYCWSGSSCSSTPCTTAVYSSPGLQAMTGLPANVCKVRWIYANPIPIASSVSNYLDVCVRSNSYAPPFAAVLPGQNIVNTVTAQASNLSTITATHTKPVDSLRPKILASKFFMGACAGCSPQTAGPFLPGQTVRWRMAVANVGNQAASPCTITDLLPTGLTYVGNPTYFYGTFNWMANQYNPPCCSLGVAVPSQVGGTISTPSPGDTALTWNFPTLPARCDGLVEYFVIEFDVKIGDAPPVPPGNYDNTFTFSATNLTTPVTSNVATLTVNAIAQLTILKEVRLKPSGTFSSGVTVPNGSLVEFRLRVKNTGNLALSNLCLLDITPHVGDIMVLPAYTSRGSAFDMPVTSAGSVIAPGGYTVGFNNGANTKNPKRTTVCGGFCGVADPPSGTGVGTAANFSPGAFSSSTYSFSVSATGATQLLPGGTLDVFMTGTAAGKAGQSACNNFAVQATPTGTSTCLSTQSVPACVTISDQPSQSQCEDFWLGQNTGPDSCCRYKVQMNNYLGAVVSLQYNVLGGSGTVQGVQTNPCPTTSTVPASLVNTTSGTLNFNPACTGNGPLGVEFSGTPTSATGEICIELIATIAPKSGGNKVECRDTICWRCPRAPQTRCDSISVKPFPYPNLDLSGRTFTVYNLKSPASPICSVKIDVVPPPSGPGVNGGGLYVDGVPKPWPFGTSVGYSQIISPIHGLPANTTVQWNLGIDYTIGWVGNVIVTVYHCDGDSCTMRYGPWKADKGPIIDVGTPVTLDSAILSHWHLHKLKFKRIDKATPIKSAIIRYSRDVESIIAVTPGSLPCDSTEDCGNGFRNVQMSPKAGPLAGISAPQMVVEFTRTLDSIPEDGLDLTVLYSSQSEKKPTVEIIYFDGNASEVGRDTATVVGTTVGGNGGGTSGMPVRPGVAESIMSVLPNPTRGGVEVAFTLPHQAHVRLALRDAAGRELLAVINDRVVEPGRHSQRLDLSGLASGTYFMLLEIDGVATVQRLELVR